MAKKKGYSGMYSNKPIEDRVIKNAVEIRNSLAQIEHAMFQHSVLCQAFLPYRNPGDVELWEREQGNVSLCIQSLKLKHFETGERIWGKFGIRPKSCHFI